MTFSEAKDGKMLAPEIKEFFSQTELGLHGFLFGPVADQGSAIEHVDSTVLYVAIFRRYLGNIVFVNLERV